MDVRNKCVNIKTIGKFNFIEMSCHLVKKLSTEIEEKIPTAKVETGLLIRWKNCSLSGA